MKEYICSMAVADLDYLETNGSIPDDWMFSLKNGKTLYDEVGGAWRERSEKTVYLCHKDAPESQYRWLHPDTMINIYKVNQ